MGTSIKRKKVVVASSVAIPIVEILDEEARNSGMTTSSLIRLFIHDGLEKRGITLPEEAVTVAVEAEDGQGS